MDDHTTAPTQKAANKVAPRAPRQIIELARNQKLVIERTRSLAPGLGQEDRELRNESRELQGEDRKLQGEDRQLQEEDRQLQEEDRVRLLEADGTTCLTIRVGAGGTIIELGGGPVALNVEGDLAISSRRLHLHGREEVAISSDADIRVEAAENSSIRAKRQEIVSTRGNLKASANDDVLIDGERIRMNC